MDTLNDVMNDLLIDQEERLVEGSGTLKLDLLTSLKQEGGKANGNKN